MPSEQLLSRVIQHHTGLDLSLGLYQLCRRSSGTVERDERLYLDVSLRLLPSTSRVQPACLWIQPTEFLTPLDTREDPISRFCLQIHPMGAEEEVRRYRLPLKACRRFRPMANPYLMGTPDRWIRIHLEMKEAHQT